MGKTHMKKWLIILVAVVVVAIAAPVLTATVVFMPFMQMATEIDEINSMDSDMITEDMMSHPAASAFAVNHPEYTMEFTNLGVGGTELVLMSENAQLSISQDTDGNYGDVVYICFLPNGASNAVDGQDVAQEIGTLC